MTSGQRYGWLVLVGLVSWAGGACSSPPRHFSGGNAGNAGSAGSTGDAGGTAHPSGGSPAGGAGTVSAGASGQGESGKGGASGSPGSAGTPNNTAGAMSVAGAAGAESEPACGNQTLDQGEACDDGNTVAGDGCNADCGLETGFTCSGEPSVCAHPSCVGLPKTCGLTGDADCCASASIPGGTFYRGYDGVTNKDKSYPATVSAFRLDTYEVTVGRYRKYWANYPKNKPAKGSGKNPSNPSDPGWDDAWNTNLLPTTRDALTVAIKCDATYQTWTADNDVLPMNCINWYEAEAFCIWDGGRLPTEAEWNFAAAGGAEQRAYPWGNSPAPVNGAVPSYAAFNCYNMSSCKASSILRVGSLPAGNGKWGNADLAGNLSETIFDTYISPYSAECVNCSTVSATTSLRSSRGGSFYTDATTLLASTRSAGYQESPYPSEGARCAR